MSFDLERVVESIISAPAITDWDRHEIKRAEQPPLGDADQVKLWSEKRAASREKLRAEMRETLPRIFSGHDDVTDAAWNLCLYPCLLDVQRREYVRIVFDNKPHPRVWSKILQAAWQRGRVGSLLHRTAFTYAEIETMFCYAIPSELMDAACFKVFESLQEPIIVYRGTNGICIGKAQLGMSWTRDERLAAQFSAGTGQRLRIKGFIRKADALAYFGHGDSATAEQEIVVRSGSVLKVEDITSETVRHDAS